MDFGELDGIMQTMLSPASESTSTGEVNVPSVAKQKLTGKLSRVGRKATVVTRFAQQ